MATEVLSGKVKITLDPKTGELIIFNNQNLPVHIKLSGKSSITNFEINVANLEMTNEGLKITGRSGRERTISLSQLNQLINFANDQTKTEMQPPFQSKEKIGFVSVDVFVHAKKEKPKMMERVVKLTESDLAKLVKKVLKEQEQTNYMFFSNLEQIKRQCEMMLEMNPDEIDKIIQNGHDWADDHITEAKTNIDQVFDFFKNHMSKESDYLDYEDINEGKKKSGTKLCARGKSAAKSKFKVYPSAYANGYAVQVCKGKIKGLDGKKQCSGEYC